MPTRAACLITACLLLFTAAARAQQGWVFDGKGQKTDQVVIDSLDPTDVFFPINVNHHWGLMNQDGQVVLFPQYDWTDYSFEGYARIIVGGKTGYIQYNEINDGTRDLLIPPQYDYADRFSNGVAVVMRKGNWGMIDQSGKDLIPMEFDGVLRMQDGFAAVQKGHRCGFINRAGKLKIPMDFQRVRSFHNGFAAVQLPDERWGYIDKRGDLVWLDKTGRVKQLGDFHEEYARVQVEVNGKPAWGYLTKAFRWRLEPAYEDARDFHDGLAAVKVKGKWGYIYPSGRWAVEPRFDEADDFDDAEGSNDFGDARRERDDRRGRDLDTAGLYAMVRVGDRWGYINRVANGGLVPQFKQARPFFRGLARVSRGESFAYVNERGMVRFDPQVATKLGFIVKTNFERARLAAGVGIEYEPGNRVIDPPEPREPFEAPYPGEHLYEEQLPVKRR